MGIQACLSPKSSPDLVTEQKADSKPLVVLLCFVCLVSPFLLLPCREKSDLWGDAQRGQPCVGSVSSLVGNSRRKGEGVQHTLSAGEKMEKFWRITKHMEQWDKYSL